MDRLIRYVWPLPGLVIAAWFFPGFGDTVRSALPSVEPLRYALLFFGPIFLVVLVHEAAHAVTALVGGLPVMAFTAFPVAAHRVDGRWRLALAPLNGLVGFVVVGAGDVSEQRFGRAYRAMTLAGPIASLCCLPMTVPALRWAFDGFPTELHLARMVGAVTFSLMTLASLSSIVPYRIRGMRSDAANLLLALRREHVATLHATARRAELIYGGMRPRDWSSDAMTELVTVVQTPTHDALQLEHRLGSAVLLSCAYVDHGQLDDALALSVFAFQSIHDGGKISSPGMQVLLVVAAHLTASHRSDIAGAKAILGRFPVGAPIRRSSLFRITEAMVLDADGRREEALHAAKDGRDLAASAARSVAVAKVELDLAEAVLTRLDAHASTRTAPKAGPAYVDAA